MFIIFKQPFLRAKVQGVYLRIYTANSCAARVIVASHKVAVAAGFPNNGAGCTIWAVLPLF